MPKNYMLSRFPTVFRCRFFGERFSVVPIFAGEAETYADPVILRGRPGADVAARQLAETVEKRLAAERVAGALAVADRLARFFLETGIEPGPPVRHPGEQGARRR